ncbi:MAG: hypothetical protein LBH07_03580 [Treponema sp.]|jgi:hypothetical protein|nr:hypothetical protein [Treponema sp.]
MSSNHCLSFENLLDETCERLQDARQQGSLKKIRKLDEILGILEQDLDGFIETNPKKE